MQLTNPIYLISEASAEASNDIGDTMSNTNERKILGHINSIKQSEFYQANAIGFKPEISFVVRRFEYKDEKKLRYNTTEYTILRTYDKGDGMLEIVCSKGVNNGSS